MAVLLPGAAAAAAASSSTGGGPPPSCMTRRVGCCRCCLTDRCRAVGQESPPPFPRFGGRLESRTSASGALGLPPEMEILAACCLALGGVCLCSDDDEGSEPPGVKWMSPVPKKSQKRAMHRGCLLVGSRSLSRVWPLIIDHAKPTTPLLHHLGPNTNRGRGAPSNTTAAAAGGAGGTPPSTPFLIFD